MGGTVWISGAGFSQGLGAPLFSDLFRSDKRVQASGLTFPDDTLYVPELYRKYTEGGSERAGVLWRDPEEFIEVLESAANEEGRSRDLLATVTGLTPDQLVDRARRLLALECSDFLRGANPKTERWQPYRTWVKGLRGEHTVVTFNYDRVLECLQDALPPLPPPIRNIAFDMFRASVC